MDMTRALQLIVRVLAVLLVGKLGMDAQTAQPLSQMIGEGVLAALLAGVDQLMHLKFFISMKAHLEALENASSDQTAAASAVKPNATLGGTLNVVAMVLLGLGLLGGMTGCAQTEKKRIAQAYTTIDATALTSKALWQNKTLTTDQAAKIKEACDVAQAAVDAWDDAQASGNTTLLNTAEAAATAALSKLSDVVSSQGVSPAGVTATATQPATGP